MSLILDALKKSEAERQRQRGPTLLEVRVTQPRRRYPAWVIAVGALLLINIGLLLAFVAHRPVSAGAAAEPARATAMPGAAGSPPPAASAAPVTVPSGGAPAAEAPAASVPGASATSSAVVAPLLPPAAASRTQPAGVDVGAASDSSANPADDAPAVSAAAAAAERETNSRYANLPSFSELGGDVPSFRLDLHVYAERARDRYALINMHRVHEGDTLPEGAHVLAITREGVALDYRGQEFMLRPQ